MESGLIFTSRTDRHTSVIHDIHNLNLSQCYDCDKIAVWVHDKMIYPNEMSGVNPNQDLPDEIIQDYNEARTIINKSPRRATALLRLCVQKLCDHLGEDGKNIGPSLN